MTIETKYNIGNVVWCQTLTGVECAKIDSIEIIDDICPIYYLKGGDIEGWYFEYELFSTQEELLKNLQYDTRRF
jgi:hypothetical protein